MEAHRTAPFSRLILFAALLALVALVAAQVADAKADHHQGAKHRAGKHAKQHAKHRKAKKSAPRWTAPGVSPGQVVPLPGASSNGGSSHPGHGTGGNEAATPIAIGENEQVPPVTIPTAPVTAPTGPNLENTISIPANAKYVSATSGSDSNAGTQSSPWKTLAKAISAAGPGSVVVLLPGTYGAVGTTTSFSASGGAGAPITYTSMPGSPAATINGYARITGSHLVFNALNFEGPTGGIVAKTSSNPGGQEVQVSVMYNSDVEIVHSEVKDNAYHAGIYVYANENIRIVSNYIHDNGDAATGANLDHGVYWCGGSGEVTGNTITDNVAYGVQLYPEAQGVSVSRNAITGNGRGGIIVASGSANNQLIENVVTDNAYYGIRGYELTGRGNTARANVLWSNPENISGSGISFSETRVANPSAS